MKRRTALKLLGAPTAAALLGTGVWREALGAPDPFRVAASRARGGPPTLTETIAAFVNRARFEDLPAAVVQKTKELLVFSFAYALEGVHGVRGKQIDALAPFLNQPGSGGASVIGRRYRLSVSDASFANCSVIRGDHGNDDVLWPAAVHTSAIIIAPALALAEVHGLSGRDMILAIVLGYEVVGKLGRAADGWKAPMPRRATTIYGAYGPVTTAGRLLKLSNSQLANAYGYAANIGIGIPEGSFMDHFYSFFAGNGVLAAQLAAAGGAAYSPTTLEGEHGLYRSFFGEVAQALPALIGAFGSSWEILNAEPNTFYTTGHITVAISLLKKILREQALTSERIEHIEAVLPYANYAGARLQALSAQGPFTRLIDVTSSLPFAFALITHFAQTNVDPKQWYDEHENLQAINDPKLLRIAKRVSVKFEEHHDSSRYARVEVLTKGGQRFRKEASKLDTSIPRSDWKTWLARGSGVVSQTQLDLLERSIADLENVPAASVLLTAATPSRA